MATSAARRSRVWTPTARQQQVLHLLASRPHTASDVESNYIGIDEAAARSIFTTLGRRGLVDVYGWDSGNRRTYTLTDGGRALERTLVEPDDELLDDD